MSDNTGFTLKAVAALLAILIPVGALIFGAARYPDRDEFNTTMERINGRLEKQEDASEAIRLEQVRQRATMEATEERTRRIEQKLDSKRK